MIIIYRPSQLNGCRLQGTNILLVAVCNRMSKKMSIPTHTSYKRTLLIYSKHTTRTYKRSYRNYKVCK